MQGLFSTFIFDRYNERAFDCYKALLSKLHEKMSGRKFNFGHNQNNRCLDSEFMSLEDFAPSNCDDIGRDTSQWDNLKDIYTTDI